MSCLVVLSCQPHAGVTKNDPFGPVPAKPPGIIWHVFPGLSSSTDSTITGSFFIPVVFTRTNSKVLNNSCVKLVNMYTKFHLWLVFYHSMKHGNISRSILIYISDMRKHKYPRFNIDVFKISTLFGAKVCQKCRNFYKSWQICVAN